MISCRDVLRQQGAFLALGLAPEVEASIRAHLETCAGCRAVLDAREPVLALARRLGGQREVADDTFVAEVLAGVHQRRLERQIARRGWWLKIAAAVLLAVLGGWAATRPGARPAVSAAALAAAHQRAQGELAFVEVEGEGVRLYQLTPAASDAVQVAFIVDPHLEL